MRCAASVLRAARCGFPSLSAHPPPLRFLLRGASLSTSPSRFLHRSPGSLTAPVQPVSTGATAQRSSGSSSLPPPPSKKRAGALFAVAALGLGTALGVWAYVAKSDFEQTAQKHYDSKAYLRAGALAPPLPPATPITPEQRAALAAELFPSLLPMHRAQLLGIESLKAKLQALSASECTVRDILDLLRHPLPAGDSPPTLSSSTLTMQRMLEGANPRAHQILRQVVDKLTKATADWGDNEAARVVVAREMLELALRVDCMTVGAVLRDPAAEGAKFAARTLAAHILPQLMLLDRRDEVVVARECLLFAMKRAQQSPSAALSQPDALLEQRLLRLVLGRAFEYTHDWAASASQYRTALELDLARQSPLHPSSKEVLTRLAFTTTQDPRAGKGVALSYSLAALKLQKQNCEHSTMEQALAIPPNVDLSLAALSHRRSEIAAILAPYSDEALKAPINPKPFIEAAADDAQARAANFLQLARILEKEGSGAAKDADAIARATAAAHREASGVRYRY